MDDFATSTPAMWLAIQFANGNAFFLGSLLIAAMAAWAMFRRHNALSRLACLVGIVFVSASSTPLPYFIYALWVACLGGVLVTSFCGMRFRRIASAALICICLSAFGAELTHVRKLGAVIDPHDRIFVIADSITAGVSDYERDKMWPTLLRNGRGLDIVDLSQPGATLKSALIGQQKAVPSNQPDHSAIVLEIGGNDLLGEFGAARFRTDLDSLLKTVRPKAHTIVMFELPLLPFHNEYGAAQRELAKKYGISLVPKRFFAGVIGAEGATIDGLHLSPPGQALMAALVSEIIGATTKE